MNGDGEKELIVGWSDGTWKVLRVATGEPLFSYTAKDRQRLAGIFHVIQGSAALLLVCSANGDGRSRAWLLSS